MRVRAKARVRGERVSRGKGEVRVIERQQGTPKQGYSTYNSGEEGAGHQSYDQTVL